MAEPAGAAPDASSHTLRRVGRVLGVLIVVGAVALSVVVWRLSNVHPRTDDAAVRANVVGIAPHVSGAIVELQVVDNQRVKAGDLLFLVDPRPYEARLSRVRAELALTQKEVEALERSVSSAGAEIARREAGLKVAEADLAGKETMPPAVDAEIARLEAERTAVE